MPGKYKKLILKHGHDAAALTVHSNCVEVILFGGYNFSPMVDTTILRFGKLVKVK